MASHSIWDSLGHCKIVIGIPLEQVAAATPTSKLIGHDKCHHLMFPEEHQEHKGNCGAILSATSAPLVRQAGACGAATRNCHDNSRTVRSWPSNCIRGRNGRRVISPPHPISCDRVVCPLQCFSMEATFMKLQVLNYFPNDVMLEMLPLRQSILTAASSSSTVMSSHRVIIACIPGLRTRSVSSTQSSSTS